MVSIQGARMEISWRIKTEPWRWRGNSKGAMLGGWSVWADSPIQPRLAFFKVTTKCVQSIVQITQAVKINFVFDLLGQN